jgi:hypothetical protein
MPFRKAFGAVICAAIAVSSCGPNSSNKESTLSKWANDDKPDEVQVVQVTDIQLAIDYSGNQVAAQQKYDGKAIDVTGVVSDVHLGLTNDPSVVLGGIDEFNRVQATFDSSQANLVKDIAIGEPVKIRCNSITSFVKSPMLSDCTSIQQFNPTPQPETPQPEPSQATPESTPQNNSVQDGAQNSPAPVPDTQPKPDVLKDTKILTGQCTSQSHIAEGDVNGDISATATPFICDSAVLSFFTDPTHVMIQFAQKSVDGSPVLAFAGTVDNDLHMIVKTVYLRPNEPSAVEDGQCRFFVQNKKLTGIVCGAVILDGTTKTAPIVNFARAPD